MIVDSMNIDDGFLACACLCALLVCVQTSAAQGATLASLPGTVRVEVGAAGGEAAAWLQTGSATGGVDVTLGWGDGTTTVLRFQNAKATGTRRTKVDGKTVTTNIPLANATIECPQLRLKLWARPNPAGYPDAMAGDLMGRWDRIAPGASDYRFPLAIRPDGEGAQYWVDGRYAGHANARKPLVWVTLRPTGGATVGEARWAPVAGDSRFLCLEVARMARPGRMADAESSLKPGAGMVEGIPFVLGKGGDNADIGQAKELTHGGMETDPYLARTAFDGLPESFLFSVPLAQYIRAWVLCAAEEDPAKDPLLTARLTRFLSDGRGDAIADTTVRLPGSEAVSAGFKQVGKVAYGEGGARHTVPLWLAEIPLKSGSIQDLVFFPRNESYNDGLLGDRRYLDFELLGKLDRAYPQNDRSHKPDRTSTNGVHVFGVTLERTPVEMEVRPTQVGNIFQGNEAPVVKVALRPHQAGRFTLTWAVHDVEGRSSGAGRKSLRLEADAPEQEVPIALKMRDKGWYGLDIALEDADGRRLVEHPASFALLPVDTRRAGLESPYGTWWFGTAHRGTDDPQIGGPLMLKAGLRHSPLGWHKCSETDMVPWKVTAFDVPWLWRSTDDPAADAVRYAQGVSNHLARFPSTETALIFHESFGGNTIPAELYDARPGVPTEEQEKRIKRMLDSAYGATRVLREKFPQLKTVFGNCNPGASLVAEFFRRGYPVANIDYLGIEAAGQTFIPERINEWGTQAAWSIRETARRFGHELPVTSAYEWLYRDERVMGRQRFAEWLARDALIANAYRFPHVSMALLYDAGNCYYNSLWGGAGLCQRYPRLYPKAAYVAYATLTRVLDGAQLVRRVPTGSLSVYVLEFKRGNEQHVYALWTPRGVCNTTLAFDGRVRAQMTDLYGRNRTIVRSKGGLALDVGTAPQYLVTDRPVTAVVAGVRRFPDGQPPAERFVAHAMDRLDGWELVLGVDERLEDPAAGNLPLRTAGKYRMGLATDAEKGACIELELLHEGKQPDIMNEYTLLKLKEPVAVPGRPSTLGLWVKGNSGWGRVMWSFEDAEGKQFISSGPKGWGCDSLDWSGEISINFDGWCFLRFPISNESPVPVLTPGGASGQWVVTNGKGRQVMYPIKVTGLAVEMTRKALDLTEMAPVVTKLRFRDLSAY